MLITHVFFDVHDVLVDPKRLELNYAANLGAIMAVRYGLTPDVWAQANRRITADWDSYYADLDLCGDDGIAHMWEGLFRTTRALFRLTGVSEPPKVELIALSRELPGLAASGCDALYPEVPGVLAELETAGLVLGVVSHALNGHICAALETVLPRFKAAIWGADNAERFDKDVQRYQLAAAHAGVPAQNCLALDDKIAPLVSARHAGMQTLLIRRHGQSDDTGSFPTLPDLRGVLSHCQRSEIV